jgi:hypothetical protein
MLETRWTRPAGRPAGDDNADVGFGGRPSNATLPADAAGNEARNDHLVVASPRNAGGLSTLNANVNPYYGRGYVGHAGNVPNQSNIHVLANGPHPQLNGIAPGPAQALGFITPPAPRRLVHERLGNVPASSHQHQASHAASSAPAADLGLGNMSSVDPSLGFVPHGDMSQIIMEQLMGGDSLLQIWLH